MTAHYRSPLDLRFGSALRAAETGFSELHEPHFVEQHDRRSAGRSERDRSGRVASVILRRVVHDDLVSLEHIAVLWC